MLYSKRPLRLLACLTALVLGSLFAASAQAENLRVLEVAPSGLPTARPAVLQETQDGLDPVSHHILFDTPISSSTAQILWYSQSDPIVMDPEGTGETYQYPMVLHASLPRDADLMYQAWSINEHRMIEGFTHVVTGPEWGVGPEYLESLPEGDYTLIVTIRTNNRPKAQATQRIAIRTGGQSRPYVPPTLPDAGPPAPGPAPEAPREQPADGRIYYVSSSTGNDANDGLTPQTAVRTPGRGVGLLRGGKPDWLLFRRGDTFRGGLGRWSKSGRSADAPMVVGSYGDANSARPLFLTDGDGLVNASGGDPISYVVFSDLHGYANERDPDHADFNGGRDVEVGIWWRRAGQQVRFENLLLEFYANAMNLGQRTEYDVREISLHRCVLRYSYLAWNIGHSQGLFADRIQGLTITECVFDHNGWNETADKAKRTGFNQNVYLHQCSDIHVEGNLFARGSHMGLKIRSDRVGITRNVMVRGNLFVENLTGMAAGSDPTGERDEPVIDGLTVTGNIFTHNGGPLPSGTVLGNAVVLSQVTRGVVSDNLFIDKTADTNWYAINVDTWRPNGSIDIQRNIVHDWPAAEPLINGKGAQEPDVSVSQNTVNLADSSYQDGQRSLIQYLQTQTAYGSIEAYYEALANPVGIDMAGPAGAPAIVDYLQQGFSR